MPLISPCSLSTWLSAGSRRSHYHPLEHFYIQITMDNDVRLDVLRKDTVGGDQFIAKSETSFGNISKTLNVPWNKYMWPHIPSAENTPLHSRNFNSHKWDVKRFGRGSFNSADKLRSRFANFYKQSSRPAHSSFTAERGPFSTASKSCCRVSANYGHIPP